MPNIYAGEYGSRSYRGNEGYESSNVVFGEGVVVAGGEGGRVATLGCTGKGGAHITFNVPKPEPDQTRKTFNITPKIVIGSVILCGLIGASIYYMKKRPKKKRIIL